MNLIMLCDRRLSALDDNSRPASVFETLDGKFLTVCLDRSAVISAQTGVCRLPLLIGAAPGANNKGYLGAILGLKRGAY
jgi:hypothetical protein